MNDLRTDTFLHALHKIQVYGPVLCWSKDGDQQYICGYIVALRSKNQCARLENQ